MATTVGPARAKADNSADRCSIAQIVWLPVRRFHVGTSAMTQGRYQCRETGMRQARRRTLMLDK